MRFFSGRMGEKDVWNCVSIWVPLARCGSLKRMHFAYFMPQFPPSLFDTLEVPPLKLHTSGQPMRISQFSECKEHVHHPLRGGHIAVNRPKFCFKGMFLRTGWPWHNLNMYIQHTETPSCRVDPIESTTTFPFRWRYSWSSSRRAKTI